MIKVEDLRIGNLLRDNLTKELLRVDSIRPNGFDCHVLNRGKNYYSQGWKAEPIPLTEEWLLEMGAVKKGFMNYPSYNLKGMQINFINGMWIEYVARIEITGVHHLQNISYFRMNEELKVK